MKLTTFMYIVMLDAAIKIALPPHYIATGVTGK